MFKLIRRKMYGLFFNIYDYYEWHDLVAVSRSKKKLIKRAKEHNLAIGEDRLILNGTEQVEAKKNETRHYVIEEIEAI